MSSSKIFIFQAEDDIFLRNIYKSDTNITYD